MDTTLYVGGTSACCKSSVLNELQSKSNWKQWKNTSFMGALGKVKNTDPLAAHTWTVTNMMVPYWAYKVLVDRTPLDNECYRMVYYLMTHEHRYLWPEKLLDDYIMKNNTDAFFRHVANTTRSVLVIDTNISRLAERMKNRNEGTDSLRCGVTDYHHFQNFVFTYINMRYPLIALFDLGQFEDLAEGIRSIQNCLLSVTQKANQFVSSKIPKLKQLKSEPVQTVLNPDWKRLGAITRR